MGYKRSSDEKTRLKKLYQATKNSYGAGAWYCERKKRLMRYSIGGINCKRSLKRQCSKAVRQYNGCLQHGKYRRIFDYHWELY